MQTKETISSILKELKKLGDADRAARDKAYHKSQREHWGIPIPICAQFVRSLCKELSEARMLQLALSLWETNLFDPMMCAAKILSLSKLLPSQELWETMMTCLEKVDGWALEDSLAHVAWKCILANEGLIEVVESWTTHENFWMRRATLVYTLPFAKPNRNPERPLRWASTYSTDSEWFIQKAIGWWLRVLGEHKPERVIVFLNSYWKNLKPVARHEATRKLDQKWKKQITLLSTEKIDDPMDTRKLCP